MFVKNPQNQNEVTLKPNDSEAIKYIFVNGKRLQSQEGQVLANKDRIIFGTNTIMLFMSFSDGKDIYNVDWETAELEMQKELEAQNKILEQENEKKKKQAYDFLKVSLEQQFNKEKSEIQDKMLRQMQEYEI